MIKTQTVDTDSDWLIVRVQSSELIKNCGEIHSFFIIFAHRKFIN